MEKWVPIAMLVSLLCVWAPTVILYMKGDKQSQKLRVGTPDGQL